MAEVAAELEGVVKVVKVDVDRAPMVAQSFRATSIPMLVLIHQGQLVNHHVGVLDKPGLLAFLEPVMPKPAGELQTKELAQLIAEQRAVPVDIRDANSFGRAHLPGAVNIPELDLEARIGELAASDGRVRVLYSRGDEPAKSRAQALAERGAAVGYLAGGLLFWEADGLPIER